jgi:hypothetical protein
MISRSLLVDDDADICEVVTLALGLDPTVVVRSCGSGGEALAVSQRADIAPVEELPNSLARLRIQGVPLVS